MAALISDPVMAESGFSSRSLIKSTTVCRLAMPSMARLKLSASVMVALERSTFGTEGQLSNLKNMFYNLGRLWIKKGF